MKILHISTSDTGGAANACIRLHQGLLEQGVESKVLVFLKKKNISGVYQIDEDKVQNYLLDKIRYFKFGYHEGINRLNLLGRSKEFDIFTSPKSLIKVHEHPFIKEADIINLHWVAYMLDYSSFFQHVKNKELVWTLHDMNPFTGGCHHSRECNLYRLDCRKCPQLEGVFSNNAAFDNLAIKSHTFKSFRDLNIVAPSRWLSNRASKSLIFKQFEHHNIPNGIDAKVFKNTCRIEARDNLSLPKNKKILLFVSDWIERKGKGFDYLLKAFNDLKNPDMTLCLAGRTKLNFDNKDIIHLGYIPNEKKMSMLYSAADLYILPSLEDNLPNTIIEALLCGTPVIAFPTGGIPEMIEHEKNGLLCENKSPEALTNSISCFLSGKYHFDTEQIRRDAIEKYGLENQAKKYIELYNHILSQV